MVAMGMGCYHCDRLGSDLCHNLVQIGNVRSCINQNCAVIALDEVEGLVIDSMSVPNPCMLVELAEHHFVVLINHFAAKITTINFCSLCLDRKW